MISKSTQTILLFVFSCISFITVHAQTPTVDRCATVQVEEERLINDPSLESREQFEEWMNTVKNKQTQESATKEMSVVYTIPVVVHVIHNGEQIGEGSNISQEQVNSQIEVLNEDFRRLLGTPGYNTNPVGADTEIEFCLAQFDPSGNEMAEPGIDRVNRNAAGFTSPSYSTSYINNTIKPNTIWNPDNYCNMWVCSITGGILGYAQFPNSAITGTGGGASTDGVVMGTTYFGRVGNVSPPYDQGRTTTHEIGHWLGLYHIWGDGNCGADDECDDTPNANGANYGCQTGSSSCSSVDMVENYMDYSDDACMNIFTICQKERMRFVMENAVRRNSLLTSPACTPPTIAPTTNFAANLTSGCPGLTIEFTDLSTANPDTWEWFFEGGTPATSNEQNPIITFNDIGSFNVSLTTTNEFGTNTSSQTDYITVSNNGIEDFFVETFESGLSNWTIENPDDDVTWEVVSVQGTTPGTQAARVNHYVYDDGGTGNRDGLISEIIDLSGRTNLNLDIEYAHRRYSQDYSDSLIIYLSTDGGNTYPNILYANAENGTGSFATGFTTTANFVPSSSEDWCFDSPVSNAECISIDLSPYEGQDMVRLKIETYNDYGNNTYVDNVTISGTCAAAIAPFTLVQANVLLEGAYNSSGIMSAGLYSSGLLPNMQPYNEAPWNYFGDETVANFNDFSPAVVDWVLLEARSASDNTVIIETHAALLLADGSIVDVDGSGNHVKFYALNDGTPYYLVVRHRNHLDVLSSNPVVVPNTISYDFSQAANVVLGSDQMVQVSASGFALRAGDFNGEGIITVNDFNDYITNAGSLNAYSITDCDFNGAVTVDDFNLYQPNSSVIGISEIRY